MRIELLGPSGIGKTTALAVAEKTRGSGACWMGPAEADLLITKLIDQRIALDDILPQSFLDGCLSITAQAQMYPSQKFRFLEMFHRTCRHAASLGQIDTDKTIVHGEMRLHRSFSFLFMASDFQRHAEWFYDNVPLPEAAIIVQSSLPVLIERAASRPSRANCYYGLDDEAWHTVLARTLTQTEIAAERLTRRGIPVRILNTDGAAEHAAARLTSLIEEICAL